MILSFMNYESSYAQIRRPFDYRINLNSRIDFLVIGTIMGVSGYAISMHNVLFDKLKVSMKELMAFIWLSEGFHSLLRRRSDRP